MAPGHPEKFVDVIIAHLAGFNITQTILYISFTYTACLLVSTDSSTFVMGKALSTRQRRHLRVLVFNQPHLLAQTCQGVSGSRL